MNRLKAMQLRRNMTPTERLIWKHLILRQLEGLKFRRQQPIGEYIVDFVCLEKRLIIEIDGGHHSQRKARDEERDRWLKSQGFYLLRFWNSEITEQIESVREVISNTLRNSPPPVSSPARGEEKYLKG